MKRREFLASGAAATAVAGIAAGAAAAERTLAAGDFRITVAGGVITVAHAAEPGRVLWETDPDGQFLIAERASAVNHVRGIPEGSFSIGDRVAARWSHPAVEAVAAEAAGVTLRGRLAGAGRGLSYALAFEAVAADQLRFTVTLDGAGRGANRVALRLASSAEEGFFGFGQQLTFFDQKGKLLPVLVQEHGVGRGRRFVTRLVDLLASRAGGSPYVTECPAPHFITSRLRSMFLENEEYSTFDLRQADGFEVKVWSGRMVGRILYGRTPLELIESYSSYAGRMRALPDWVHGGVIAGVQGGSAVVRRKLATLRQAGVPLAGLWIQDWTGVRTTEVGQQLWWDWRLDEGYYPDWSALVADVEAGGGRVLGYINPFLSLEPGHDALFVAAREAGYLVEREDGTPYLIRNTTFDAALVDLSNPAARVWIKGIIKDRLIGRQGSRGG